MMKLGLAGVVMIAIGCGGGSSGVPIDQFSQAYSTAICTQNFKCCSAADLQSRTMSDCINNNETAFSLLTSTIQTAQSQGRVRYDAAKAGACIDGIKAMSCADWQKGLTQANQPAACNTFVVPLVNADGMCTSDQECTSNHCAGADSTTSPPTPGMCAPTVAAGGSCANGETCATDLYCASDGTCQPNKVAGQACTADDECTNSCNTDTQQCSCYNGCAVVGPVSRRAALSSLLLLGAALAGARYVRRRRR